MGLIHIYVVNKSISCGISMSFNDTHSILKFRSFVSTKTDPKGLLASNVNLNSLEKISYIEDYLKRARFDV